MKYLVIAATIAILGAFSVRADNRDRAGECDNNLDALFFVPGDPDETVEDIHKACHSNRGADIEVSFVSDVPLARVAVTPGFAAHYDMMGLGHGYWVTGRMRLGISVFKQLATAHTQAEAEVAKVFCNDEGHCFLAGGTFGHDGRALMDLSDEPSSRYARYTAAKIHAEAGYLFSKNNQTFLVKALGGASLDYQNKYHPRGDGLGPSADVGASIEYYSKTKLSITAAVMQHLGLFDQKDQITSGKLEVRVRLYRNPDGSNRRASIRDVYWQAHLEGYQGELAQRDRRLETQPAEPARVQIRNLTGGTGLVIGF